VNAVKPEILHSYSFFTNFAAWWASYGTGTISIGSIRNDFNSDCREAGSVLGRLSARWPSTQICNSIAAKMAVERTNGPFKPSRLHLVPNGLDLTRFDPTIPLPSVPLLVAIGRLCPAKRWDRLVRAVARAKAKGLRFLVQHAGDGPLRSALEAQTQRAGVERLITFLGERHDVPRLLAQATALVHTADEEGCPNVIMEAMACGRAVVATDAGHSPYLVENGKTGFLVRRGDETMLADRIGTLIENRELAARMGQRGRTKMEREFGIRQLLQETFRAYRDAGWKE
jgi:glycosyltransferase involved in cell wall biosynthesis